MSIPSGSSWRPSSRNSCAIFAPSRSGIPVSTGIAPRIGETPARKFSGGSHGANSWWWRAADPKSHRIGSAPRMSSVKRAFLSRAHSPMCVLVT